MASRGYDKCTIATTTFNELIRRSHCSQQMLTALKNAETVLARMDTLRHLEPDFPVLDEVRIAIHRAETKT